MRFFRKAAAASALVVISMTTAWGADAQQRTILVFDEGGNYGAGGPFYVNIFTALRSTIAAAQTAPISIFLENLHFLRLRSEAYEKAIKPFLEAKYQGRPISAIVAVGSSTLEFVLRLRTEMWSDVPIVFAMVDEATLSRLQPPTDVTGTAVKLRLRDSLDVARAVVPGLHTVAIVGERWDAQVVYRNFKDEIPSVAGELEVMDLAGLPMSELTPHIAALPKNAAIIYTALFSDGEGRNYSAAEALSRIAMSANRPIVVSAETQIGYGGIGGYVLSPFAIGETAARQVLQILNNETKSRHQRGPRDLVRPIFDWRQMQRWGVAASVLPENSEIRFRRPTAWDQYRDQILLAVTAIVVQTALITWLLFERRRRRHSEAVARETRAELDQVSRFAIAGELSASIAHEVNQPLTGIVANANAALRWLTAPDPNVEKARAALTQIVGAGHRASDVVRGIRAIFKRDDGDQRSIVDLNTLIATVLGVTENDLNMQLIAVEKELTPDLPLVYGDRSQLQQVLLNLISNAVDSMASEQKVRRVLSVRSEVNDASEIQISVQDSGSGIKPTDMERIFKPLFTTKSRGMGMGLSICRSIVERHGGRIWASSDGSGAVFTFVVPEANHKGSA
jgi:signal transduction histidine kinase